MISVLTTYRVSKGQEGAFESAFAELQQQVVTKESGTIGFQLYRAADGEGAYKLIAHFRDEAAMDEHNAGPWLQTASKQLFAACEAPPEAEVFRAL